MKTLLQIIVIISITISCKDEIKEGTIEKEQKEVANKIQIDTFSFDGKHEENKTLILSSELKYKLERLADLDNNYKIEKIGKYKFEESIVYQGIKRLPELSFEEQIYKVKNLDSLQDRIEEINFAFIKGTKDLGSKTFARAKIEELIFMSEESANKLVEFVNQIKEKGNTWEDIDKSPNSIFNERNRVYYISSGGWYMKPFYQEIEKKMKK